MAERFNFLASNPYIDGPAQYLVKKVCTQLSSITKWKKLFGDFINPYMRMDYGFSNLPALRIYNENYTKDFESWFINGTLKADIIFPATMRRDDLELLSSMVAAAVLQQFRSPTFFAAIGTDVPGLNELGKVVTVNKALTFDIENNLVPLTQMELNFRIDLRVWDQYLTDTNRTKDTPFEETLGDLESIITTIKALNDDDTSDVTITSEQEV